MKHLFASISAATLLSLGSLAAHANSIPYPNAGTVAPQVTLKAASTGDVYGYFVQGGAASGGTAGDTDYMYLYDLTTNTHSSALFNNQTTVAGAAADFGHVNAGDILMFKLYDASTSSIAASIASYSGDGLNHAYVTAYSGGTMNGASLPAGTFIGMEDRLSTQGSDFNYNDDTFVFTNVAQTPEPGSLALLGTGLFGVVGSARRRLFA